MVHSITEEDTVFEAIRRMDELHIGALMVMEGEKMVGIITERDYARKVILKGRASATTKVGEIMSHRVSHVRPGDTVEYCLALMTERNVRHLPVMDHGRVVGLLSMRDLVAGRREMNEFILARLRGSAPEQG